MLTADEKRFIKYWEDQRKGGRTQYFLLYILAGTFVASIVILFVSMMLGLSFAAVVIWVLIASFVLITVATVFSWTSNENRFKAIIKREIAEGKVKDTNQ